MEINIKINLLYRSQEVQKPVEGSASKSRAVNPQKNKLK
jgi:hypothetical protein